MRWILSTVIASVVLAQNATLPLDSSFDSNNSTVDACEGSDIQPEVNTVQIYPTNSTNTESDNFCSERTQGQKIPYKQAGVSYYTAAEKLNLCPLTSEPVCYHGETKEHMEKERFPLCWTKTWDFYSCTHQVDGVCPPEAVDLSKVCIHDAQGSNNRIYMDLFVYNYQAYPGFVVDPSIISVHQADTCVKNNAAYLKRY